MKQYYIILFCIALLGITTNAQDLKKDIEVMQQAYLSLENFSAQMSVRVYDTKGSSIFPSRSQVGAIKIAGNKTWYKMNEITLVRTKYEALMINDEYKMAVYGSIKKKDAKSNKEIILPDLDKAFQNYKKVVYKGTVGNDKHYHIQFVEGSPYSEADIYIDKDLMLIHKMTYESYNELFDQHTKTVLAFSNMSVQPIQNTALFSIKNYIKKENGAWKGINSLSGYEIIDSEKTSQDFK